MRRARHSCSRPFRGVLSAALRAPGLTPGIWATSKPDGVTDRTALATLPLLRKSDLPALQKADPPFGGLVSGLPGRFWTAVYLTGADLRARGTRGRPVARRGAVSMPWV